MENTDMSVRPSDEGSPKGELSTTDQQTHITDPQPSGGTSKKSIKISGKEFQLPDDVIEALEKREKEFSQKLSEQGEELGQLKKQISTPKVPQEQLEAAEIVEEEDLATLAFTDPTAYKKKIKDMINAAKVSVKEEIRQEYLSERKKEQAMETINKFWTGFYSKYPELEQASIIAEQVLQKDFSKPVSEQEIANLLPEKAIDVLALQTKKYLLGLGVQSKENTGLDAVSGGSLKQEIKTGSVIVKPKTLTEIVRSKRKGRF